MRHFLFLFFIISCAQVPERPVPVTEKFPQVLYLIPSPGTVSTAPQLIVIFSKPIDATTVGNQSIVLSEGALDLGAYQNPSELHQAIDRGSLSMVPLDFSVAEDKQAVLIKTTQELSPDRPYSLIVTSRLLSFERVPITPYVAVYQSAKDLENPGDQAVNSDAVSKEPIGTAAPTQPPGGIQATIPIGSVVLNKIYYDAVGSDTDGVLFVELFGTSGMGLAGYKINFINGSDGAIYDSITLPDSAKIGTDGFYLIADAKTNSPNTSFVVGADLIDSFDPQNGPDAVQLLDPTGRLADAVGYGEGIVPVASNGLAAFEGQSTIDVVNGHSLERKLPGIDTGNNFNDFIDREVPTPGS